MLNRRKMHRLRSGCALAPQLPDRAAQPWDAIVVGAGIAELSDRRAAREIDEA